MSQGIHSYKVHLNRNMVLSDLSLWDSLGSIGVHLKTLTWTWEVFFLEFFLTKLVPAASWVMMENAGTGQHQSLLLQPLGGCTKVLWNFTNSLEAKLGTVLKILLQFQRNCTLRNSWDRPNTVPMGCSRDLVLWYLSQNPGVQKPSDSKSCLRTLAYMS